MSSSESSSEPSNTDSSSDHSSVNQKLSQMPIIKKEPPPIPDPRLANINISNNDENSHPPNYNALRQDDSPDILLNSPVNGLPSVPRYPSIYHLPPPPANPPSNYLYATPPDSRFPLPPPIALTSSQNFLKANGNSNFPSPPQNNIMRAQPPPIPTQPLISPGGLPANQNSANIPMPPINPQRSNDNVLPPPIPNFNQIPPPIPNANVNIVHQNIPPIPGSDSNNPIGGFNPPLNRLAIPSPPMPPNGVVPPLIIPQGMPPLPPSGMAPPFNNPQGMPPLPPSGMAPLLNIAQGMPPLPPSGMAPQLNFAQGMPPLPPSGMSPQLNFAQGIPPLPPVAYRAQIDGNAAIDHRFNPFPGHTGIVNQSHPQHNIELDSNAPPPQNGRFQHEDNSKDMTPIDNAPSEHDSARDQEDADQKEIGNRYEGIIENQSSYIFLNRFFAISHMVSDCFFIFYLPLLAIVVIANAIGYISARFAISALSILFILYLFVTNMFKLILAVLIPEIYIIVIYIAVGLYDCYLFYRFTRMFIFLQNPKKDVLREVTKATLEKKLFKFI